MSDTSLNSGPKKTETEKTSAPLPTAIVQQRQSPWRAPFVFALMAFIGLGWAGRQERRALTLDEDGPEAPEPQPRPRRRAPSDDEVEDGILDGTR